MTRRQDVLPNSDFLVHFYLVMHLGLTSEDQVFCDSFTMVVHFWECAYNSAGQIRVYENTSELLKFSVVLTLSYTIPHWSFQNVNKILSYTCFFSPLTSHWINQIWILFYALLYNLTFAYVVNFKKASTTFCWGSTSHIVWRTWFWSYKNVWMFENSCFRS